MVHGIASAGTLTAILSLCIRPMPNTMMDFYSARYSHDTPLSTVANKHRAPILVVSQGVGSETIPYSWNGISIQICVFSVQLLSGSDDYYGPLTGEDFTMKVKKNRFLHERLSSPPIRSTHSKFGMK